MEEPAPTQEKLSLTVGCPAYNEEASVEGVVREVVALLRGLDRKFELLLVNDGSTDGTRACLDRSAAEFPEVRVVHHSRNLGFAGFARSLCLGARMDAYVGISADGEIDIPRIEEMLSKLERGADIVVGVRKQKANYSPYRKLISTSYNRLVALRWGTNFRDIGGPKMWRTQLLQSLPMHSKSPFLNAELLVRARKRGARVDFVEVKQRPRTGGKAKGARLSWLLPAIVDFFTSPIFWGRY